MRKKKDPLLESFQDILLLRFGIHLSRRQTLILLTLIGDRIINKEEIADALYTTKSDPESVVTGAYITTIVCQLRKKLTGIVEIETHWSRGHRARWIKDPLRGDEEPQDAVANP